LLEFDEERLNFIAEPLLLNHLATKKAVLTSVAINTVKYTSNHQIEKIVTLLPK
jgi:hypothetical protein